MSVGLGWAGAGGGEGGYICEARGYLVLGVSGADQQQLQRPQVSHSLTRSPDCGLQKGLAQLSEDSAIVQDSAGVGGRKAESGKGKGRHRRQRRKAAGLSRAVSLVQVLAGHGHVVGRLQRQDAPEELQRQRHVGLHVFDGVEGGAHAVGGRLVQVGGGVVPLLPAQRAR